MSRFKLCLLFSHVILISTALPVDQWVSPFDDKERLGTLCTDNNHFDVMRGRESPLLNNLIRHPILCNRKHDAAMQSRRYEGLIWFMRSLGFCDINRYTQSHQNIEFKRDFQLDLLRAAFAVVCHRTDDIGRFHLSGHADLFRIIYEKENEHRSVICNSAILHYQDVYKRCHVEYSVESSSYSLDLIRNKCTLQQQVYLLRPRAFFARFSRLCQPYSAFVDEYSKHSLTIGQALANDTIFMNIMSVLVKRAVNSYSQLPYLVLKTRLLLQHFAMAAVKMSNKLDMAAKCKVAENGNFSFDESNSSVSTQIQLDEIPVVNAESCNPVDAGVYDSLDIETQNGFQNLGYMAWLGLKIELGLLTGVSINTFVLSILLVQTRKHLSTATILFIFNILFSNVLFVASFICLFADFFTDLPFLGIDEIQYSTDVPLDVAETLQAQLFAPIEFLKHLVQETLFSLAQNGSLLGLTHLLVLVLVVINRSMSGKAIKLSKKCVISVFSCVWIFLIVTHVIFSALQFSAIINLDHLFSQLKKHTGSLKCSENQPKSDYIEIGERCDRVAIFHTFGVYLLRGHTLFTLTFLLASIIVFTLTVVYHWRVVSSQHDFLSSGLREQSPHRRRETLFNTLLLSIGAFFVSVSGQSFIEIAVFWVDDRAGIANMATLYQWTRMASFVDPLFNPILVAVRTPTIRRKLRLYIFIFFQAICTFLCPCQSLFGFGLPWTHRRKRSTLTTDSRVKDNYDTEVTFKVLCSKQFVRSSLLKRSRSRNSSRNHSVV
ncbi:unnamed protein product [Bursaphelenchus xylophilus]|uniref:(pine wood nematode) hypothetical protein n=1 Tax=Bursaphelenchus xylophilus TaxID=6326 RepID=A0A1I7RY01_BURXY|nr:unnamed protein product [Bursaphelenchus xylophilus]CAG9085141.1 unnamed protein product [Bursaphelenchus xylophilus]